MSIDQLRVEFSGKNLTLFGGMKLFARFVKKLAVEGKLDLEIKLEGRRKSEYSVGRLLLSLIYGFVVNLHRISDTILLRVDKVFLKIVEFHKYPHQTTLSRFLQKFSVPVAKKIGQVNVKLLKKVRKNFEGYKKITLDIDSHVKTVYGNQQKAEVGYNPKKPGRKSFHPLFCFIGETRDFLWGRFRPGRNYSGKGVEEFLKECLKLLPEDTGEIFLRGDSSCYDSELLKEAERRKLKYAIAVKLYSPIQLMLSGVKYIEIGGGKEVGEFQYQARDWEKPRRMVVIREKVEVGEEKKQLKLLELQGYNYQVIVTDIEDMSAEEVWLFYNQRANVENMIKEGIFGYGLDVCVSHWYGANVAHFFLVMLAYNLMNWFKEKILGQNVAKKMAKWLRMRILLIPGRLIKSGRRWTLKLASDYPWQKEYWRAEERLRLLRFTG